MKMRRIFGWHFFEYIMVSGLISFLNLLPPVWVYKTAQVLGDSYFAVFPGRRKTVFDNLSIAYGDLPHHEKERLARAAMRNLTASLIDFFMTPSAVKNAEQNFEFEGTEHLDRAFERGNGVIFVISHLGSWEYLAFLPYLRKYPCSVVVRNIRNPYLEEWSRKNRQITGLNPIDREKSVRKILTELKKNHLVAILIDQWAGPEGLWQKFFSKETSTTSIPARLAEKTKAALIPGYCLRTAPGKFKIIIHPEVSLVPGADWEAATTALLNRQLEEQILKYPEQWIWAHRRWKDKTRFRANAVAEMR